MTTIATEARIAFTVPEVVPQDWLADLIASTSTSTAPARMVVKASSEKTRPSTVPEQVPWVTETLTRVNRVAELPPDWDSEGSPPTDPKQVRAALQLLDRLCELTSDDPPAPYVCPVSGGGLQFEWSVGNRSLELEFSQENTVLFLTEEQSPSGETEAMASGEYRITRTEKSLRLVEWLLTGRG